MLKVAAYLLERTERMKWLEARRAEFAEVNASVLSWLEDKGASSGASGTYEAEDGADLHRKRKTGECAQDADLQ